MGLEQSTIQDHFVFGKMKSMYLQAPREDMMDRDHTVKGLQATVNEYNVALALDRMNLDYNFQMTIGGGRGQAFVTILDFLVFTVPLPTPLWVHGEHWHMGDRRAKDIRQQTEVDEALGGAAGAPVEIWGDQSKTKEKAYYYVRQALR